ncbi:hypothetical protein [Agromyces sp. NPDC058126]|uniref:hypothetical protein n=1 Tax=Agromyces sp. NPDC058126 TaxID=3346350 RepID=UPI0036DDCC9F
MKDLLLKTMIAADGVLPDPVPEQPPGTEGVTTFLNWLAWGAIACGVAGFLISCGILAFSAITGREVNGFKGIAISIIVCILVAGVGGILATFVG